MNRLPDPVEPLPRVTSPSAWSWRYFRQRHLPSVASVVAGFAGLWLWAVNLPESVGSGESGRAELPVAESAHSFPFSGTASDTNVVVADSHAPQLGDNRTGAEKFANHD
jgi:hypothetical protein